MRYFYKTVAFIEIVAFSSAMFLWPFVQSVSAVGNTQIRQEVNILDAKLNATANNFATSSEIIAITDNNYSSPAYYFEAVASTSAATNASVYLVNATSSAKVATLTANSNGSYTRYRSTQFVPNASTTVEYKVVIGNENVVKDVLAARVVVLQNAVTLSNTETQVEIGSATTTASNTANLPLQFPKYWTYTSSSWDASPAFYVEAAYNISGLIASSTTYNANGTYTYVTSSTTKYTVVEAWGAGGGGAITTTTGGAGGGGGAYARSTTTPAVGSSHTLVVGKGGTADDAVPATNSTYDSTTVVADHGIGGKTGASVSGGLASNSTGQVTFSGGISGIGVTTNDTNGGGGGAAGPDGAGEKGADAQTSLNGAGGRGDNTLGGTAGTAATFGAGTVGGNGGANVLGGGGGGGSGNNNSGATGSNGGLPGGGGGGEDGGTVSPTGADGQIKLTEWGGYVGIALQEDDGNFGSWSFNSMVVTQGTATTTTRVRSAAFTPSPGKHYRLVASTTQSSVTYNIYTAKIVVDQIQSFPTYFLVVKRDGVRDTSNFYSATFCQGSVCYAGGTRWDRNSNAWSQVPGAYLTFNLYNSSPTLFDTQPATTGGGSVSIQGGTASSAENNQATSQQITPTLSYSLKYIDVNLNKTLAPTDNVFVELHSDSPTGTLLATSDSINGAAISTTAGFIRFTLASPVAIGPTGGMPTLLEPQYQLANTKYSSGTALQNFITDFDPAEWSTTNNYLHAVSAGASSASVAGVYSTGGTLQTNSTVSSPNNFATSTLGICMPSVATDLDTKATTNNNDLYSDEIIVQVGTASTAGSCGALPPAPSSTFTFKARLIINRQTIVK